MGDPSSNMAPSDNTAVPSSLTSPSSPSSRHVFLYPQHGDVMASVVVHVPGVHSVRNMARVTVRRSVSATSGATTITVYASPQGQRVAGLHGDADIWPLVLAPSHIAYVVRWVSVWSPDSVWCLWALAPSEHGLAMDNTCFSPWLMNTAG